MFEVSHMAVGALCQVGLRRKLPVAAVAFTSHAVLDSTKIWHAPYPWPDDTPVVFHFLPYPHNLPSILTLIALVVATIIVGFLLRKYWWGMIWAIAPDLIDWIILRPITGRSPIHDFFDNVSTPWGFAVETAFVVIILLVILKRRQNSLVNSA